MTLEVWKGSEVRFLVFIEGELLADLLGLLEDELAGQVVEQGPGVGFGVRKLFSDLQQSVHVVEHGLLLVYLGKPDEIIDHLHVGCDVHDVDRV